MGCFKLLPSQCPHHQYSLIVQVQFVFDRLTLITQNMVDIAAREYISDKTRKELVSLYELLLARNSQQKLIQGKTVGVHEVNVP